MKKSIEQKAIKQAILRYKSKGYKVDNVSRGRIGRGHKGYDLIIKKSGKLHKIEVKGTSKVDIPDLYETEWDGKKKKLVADLMMVVSFQKTKPTFYEIKRRDLESQYVTPKHGWRISSRFKNPKNLRKYLK